MLRPARPKGKENGLHIFDAFSIHAFSRNKCFKTVRFNEKSARSVELAQITTPIVMRIFPEQGVKERDGFCYYFTFDIKSVTYTHRISQGFIPKIVSTTRSTSSARRLPTKAT